MPVEEDFVTLETPEADWQKYRTVKLNETAVFPREAQRFFLSLGKIFQWVFRFSIHNDLDM